MFRLNRRQLLVFGIPSGFLLGATLPVATPQDLEAALGKANPGDTIVLRNGTWENAELRIAAQGTPDAPIRVVAETPGKVVLTGKSKLAIGGSWLRVESLLLQDCTTPSDLIAFRTSKDALAHHCELIDCAVVNSKPTDAKLTTRYLSLYGTHNTVRRCYFAGKRNLGPTLVVWLGGPANRHRIVENWFGPRPALQTEGLGNNGGETIRVGDSATSLQDSFTVIADNLFAHCNGEIEAISNKSCGNLYRGNLFYLCDATLTLRHGNRCRVEGNYFFGGGSAQAGGIRIIGEGHQVCNNLLHGLGGRAFRAAISVVNGLPNTPLNGYARVRGGLVAHNTMLDCAEPFAVGTSGGNAKLTEAPEGIRIVANRIATSAEYRLSWPMLPRPKRLPVADGQVNEVTLDITNTKRKQPKRLGCQEAFGPEAERWVGKRLAAGPSWWPRGQVL